MPLNGFSSLCDARASIIISKDKGNPQKHTANNVNQAYVTHYQIDGVVIKEGQNKCDFLLLNEDTKTAYLIDLKGSDLCKAAQQLEATENILSNDLTAYEKQYRVVANKCKTQEINSSSYIKYKMKWGHKLVQKTETITENI